MKLWQTWIVLTEGLLICWRRFLMIFNLCNSSCGLKVWLATGVLTISKEEMKTGQTKETRRRKCTKLEMEMIGELKKHKLKSIIIIMLQKLLFLVSIEESVWVCSHYSCLLLPSTKTRLLILPRRETHLPLNLTNTWIWVF